jgi:hypothetical protein
MEFACAISNTHRQFTHPPLFSSGKFVRVPRKPRRSFVSAAGVQIYMKRTIGRFVLPLFFALVPLLSVSAKEGFFIAPAVETSLFSAEKAAFGAGLAFGYDGGITMGYRALVFADPDGLVTLELCLFLRVYLPLGRQDGFFIQAGAGPSVLAPDGVLFPPKISATSAGISLGWRFPLGSRFYIEPALRAGYPYVAGAGVSAGFRF